METTYVTAEDLQTFRTALLEEVKTMFSKGSSHATPPRVWLRPDEVCRMLRVSVGTLQNIRLKGALPYTKIGGLVYIHFDDIKQMMDANKTVDKMPDTPLHTTTKKTAHGKLH